eukprot:6039728-Pyramimonas_sp.AAC.1
MTCARRAPAQRVRTYTTRYIKRYIPHGVKTVRTFITTTRACRQQPVASPGKKTTLVAVIVGHVLEVCRCERGPATARPSASRNDV